jgi:branched-chain amino acid transport system ATP-binding protein
MNTHNTPALFACENISIDLGGREILRKIELEIRPGEVLGIIGPNGAGKTSLIEILSGRYVPKTGKVFYKGRDITKQHLYERARMGIGRTYQTPVVPEDLTVGQTFKAARQAYAPYLTRYDAEYAANLVNFFVNYEVPTSVLETFNRRKLLLATILLRTPELLLMDEPAAGLINSEIDEIDEILRMLSKEMNIAVIIVEHRIELLDTIADSVIVMDAGEIIAKGKLHEIISSPAVRAAYFETAS